MRNLKEETGATYNNILLKFLNDPDKEVRLLTLYAVDVQAGEDFENKLISLAQKDPSMQVRSSALSILAENPKPTYREMFKANLAPGAGTTLFSESLHGLYKIDAGEALRIARANEKSTNSSVKAAILDIYLDAGDPGAFPMLESEIGSADGFEAFNIFGKYTEMLLKQNEAGLRHGVEKLGAYRNSGGSQWRIYSIAKALYDIASSDNLEQIAAPARNEIQATAKQYLNQLIDGQQGKPIYTALENFKLD